MLDLAIIGSGPAALSAALYAARAGLSVKVFEKKSIGGALNEIEKIENYPGFVGAGADLAKNMRSQAKQFGAVIDYGELSSITQDQKNNSHILTIDDEQVIARAVLVATGSEPRSLDFKIKPPVSYCVACDGANFKGKNIAVIGGGNSAVQESLILAEIVKNLTLISHTPLRAECCLIDCLKSQPNVTIQENLEPTAEILNQYDGVFVFIGKRPATTFLPKSILSKDNRIKTISPESHQTNISGIFAAGDVREGSIHQAIIAAGDGAAAALEIIKYLR